MISYMYTFDYEDEQRKDPGSEVCSSKSANQTSEMSGGGTQASPSDQVDDSPALFSSVRLYAMADKYGIIPLKELAKQRFSDWTATNWAHKTFPDLVREIYE